MLVDIIIYQLYIGVQEMVDIHSVARQSSIEAELIDDRLFTVTNIHDSLDLSDIKFDRSILNKLIHRIVRYAFTGDEYAAFRDTLAVLAKNKMGKQGLNIAMSIVGSDYSSLDSAYKLVIMERQAKRKRFDKVSLSDKEYSILKQLFSRACDFSKKFEQKDSCKRLVYSLDENTFYDDVDIVADGSAILIDTSDNGVHNTIKYEALVLCIMMMNNSLDDGSKVVGIYNPIIGNYYSIDSSELSQYTIDMVMQRLNDGLYS